MEKPPKSRSFQNKRLQLSLVTYCTQGRPFESWNIIGRSSPTAGWRQSGWYSTEAASYLNPFCAASNLGVSEEGLHFYSSCNHDSVQHRSIQDDGLRNYNRILFSFDIFHNSRRILNSACSKSLRLCQEIEMKKPWSTKPGHTHTHTRTHIHNAARNGLAVKNSVRINQRSYHRSCKFIEVCKSTMINYAPTRVHYPRSLWNLQFVKRFHIQKVGSPCPYLSNFVLSD